MEKLSHLSTEKSVLSTVLNNIDLGWLGHVLRVAGNNPADIFSSHTHRAIFQAADEVCAKMECPSVAAVTDRIKERYSSVIENPDDAISAILLYPSLSSVEQVTSSVEELSSLREIRNQISGMEEIIQDIGNSDVSATPDDVATRLQGIIDNTNVTTTVETFGDIASDILASPAPMWNVKTGIEVIDRALGGNGLESGCFTIAAARPKVGKTILMNNLINTVMENGAIPLVLNLETKKVEFFAKMVSRHIADKNIHWGKIKSYLTEQEMEYPLDQSEIDKIEEGFRWAQEQEWLVSFDKSMSIHDVHALVMKAKATYPADAKIVLFVDYIQLQVQNSLQEREEITNWSRFYKKLAGSMDISVFALAQVNRGAADQPPQVHQLRGSGSLEQDADTILLLDRPHTREPEDDKKTPPYQLDVDASTSRLAQGEKESCFIDGGIQLVTNMPEHLRTDNLESDFDMQDI